MTDLFATSVLALPKNPRKVDRAHLGFIAQLPCVKCFVQFQIATREVHVAHVRFGDPERGKPPTGMREKPSDKWTVPLCATHHMLDQHDQNERLFWEKLGVDVLTLCEELYAKSGDRAAAHGAFVRQANRARRLPPGTPYKLRHPDSPEAKAVIEKYLKKEGAHA